MTERPAPYSHSLTARLAIGLSALLMVGGVVLTVAAYAYGQAAAREAFDRLLVGAANDIAAAVTVENGRVVVDLPVAAFELLALAPDDRIAYQVRDMDGTILTGYETLPPAPETGGQVFAFFNADFLGEPARYIRLARRFAERSLSGSVDIIVGQTLRARNELAYDITRNALAGLAIGGIAMLVLAVIVVRSALRPLDRLARQMASRDPQDLTPLDTRVPREVAPLVLAVNTFIGRLDRQFNVMRNLISDTAHQLRTPVAALRAQADLALREAHEDRRARLVARIHRRSVGLGQLLDQILSRALVVHRLDSVRRETVDLREIALDIVESEDHVMIAPGTEVRLRIGDEPVTVLADTFSLREAVKNLFTNALRHGTTPITVGVSRQDKTALVWVLDAGKGPPAEIRDDPGTRFLRSAASSGQSSGLGLSIAKEVAEAFGGRLVMDTTADGFRIGLALRAIEDRP